MRKQNGFTLIELMIASVIGLTVMIGIMNLFITTNRSVILSDALSQNQETGRFAMEYLTRYIRTAGYTEASNVNMPPLFVPSAIRSQNPILCDPTTIQSEACAANNPGGILGDRLSIPFLVDTGAVATACTGANLGPGFYVNVFWVSSDTDTLRELRCRTYDHFAGDWLGAAISIINNVAGLEFQVGLAASNDDKHTARYVSIDTLFADTAAGTSSIESMRSMRIALLTTSQDALDEKKRQSDKKDRIYGLLETDLSTYSFTGDDADGSLRNIFSNTIPLPNMIDQLK